MYFSNLLFTFLNYLFSYVVFYSFTFICSTYLQYCIICLYIRYSITTPFSFVNFTIHRYCTIAYHGKPFFKKKRWVIISIVGQRIIELIIGLPYIVLQQRVSTISLLSILLNRFLIENKSSTWHEINEVNFITSRTVDIFISSSKKRFQLLISILELRNSVMDVNLYIKYVCISTFIY